MHGPLNVKLVIQLPPTSSYFFHLIPRIILSVLFSKIRILFSSLFCTV